MKTIDITTYRINRLLKEKNWTQNDLANRLGVTQQTIQKWVKGKSSPSMENIDKLTDITGHPPYWFMLPPDDGDQVVTPDSMKIGTMQLDLLKTFNAFPEEDQQQMLSEMKERKESMDKTVARWIAAQKNHRT
ncbi:helix-turn-helix domain-containing protein [Pectobacterium zantedeschiae]|uniref:Helix-turn-helix domain-containing protein n=1 Tax=Pectobacterium zantedeschiae TaxID=2034769 RepID=A0A9X8JK85_9GAMM|nr:helix-turn-helix domain-containing protein [Pectobacterium zantedeschiae]RYC44639.1 helix-turn-helix domain-containing protein [Pectobacterium zantedeschiae]RYC49796.1 XRE family transcriptional regulator [Pectobacterium zantedeschiae]